MPPILSKTSTFLTQAFKLTQTTKRGQISKRFKSFLSQELLDVYQYLAPSKLPTNYFQDVLPHLPVPDLTDTLLRYLRAQMPLLTTEQLCQTDLLVQQFHRREGRICQDSLIARDKRNEHTSYISKPWFDLYLRDRRPLPINSNPFLVFKYHPKYDHNQQVVRACNLVIASLRFYKSLKKGNLEPEIFHSYPMLTDREYFKTLIKMLPQPLSCHGAHLFKAFPLDMSQYNSLFSTTRIPMPKEDWIKHRDFDRKHIVVIRKGHFYVFDALDENGDIASPEEILSTLQKIASHDAPAAEHPVGVLTTEDRTTWALARIHLEKIGNLESLELIDNSLFALALDEDTPGIDPVRLVKLFLHGDGNNRWFDKSISLIVTGDGTAGINFEHSWGDGVAVLRYFNDIYKDNEKRSYVHNNTVQTETLPLKKLDFILDDKAKVMIANAKEKYENTCKSLKVNTLEYSKFGRNLCEELKISPDAVMQLAFQLAYDSMKGTQVSTYESCSTAAFKHGRTETVRPCTLATQRLCYNLRPQQMCTSLKYLKQMVVESSKCHTRLIREAAMGQGFDRHLFALRLEAEALGLSPGLFEDRAYRNLNHNILSTSTFASEALMLGGFGPLVNDGFGVSYSTMEEKLKANVTSYSGQANGAEFISSLIFSLNKIYAILAL